jgi:hypothetical protein
MGGGGHRTTLTTHCHSLVQNKIFVFIKEIIYEIITDSHFQQMTTKGGQNFAWRTKLNEFID